MNRSAKKNCPKVGRVTPCAPLLGRLNDGAHGVTRPTRFVATAIALLLVAGLPVRALACATCYGASDSPMAQGMNWGIITLLGFVGMVLGGISLFFVHIGRRSARFNAAEQSQNPTDQQP